MKSGLFFSYQAFCIPYYQNWIIMKNMSMQKRIIYVSAVKQGPGLGLAQLRIETCIRFEKRNGWNQGPTQASNRKYYCLLRKTLRNNKARNKSQLKYSPLSNSKTGKELTRLFNRDLKVMKKMSIYFKPHRLPHSSRISTRKSRNWRQSSCA